MASSSRLTVLALVLAMITAPCPGQTRRSRQMLEQANEALAAGLHHKAVELYTTLLDETPDSQEARHRRAVAYSQIGEVQKALDDVGLLLQANPKHGEGLVLRGDLLLEKDRPANAAESYSRAIQAGVNTAAVFSGRAGAYAQLHQWDKAVADYSEAIHLRLNNAVSHKDRGVALVALGRLQDAIEDFDRAIALKPDYWDAYVERAQALGKTGRIDLAMPDLNKVLAAQPSSARALGLRGSANMINGDLAKAVEDYSRGLEASPHDVQLLLSRGAAYARMGEHRKALKDRDEAVRLRPRSADGYLARGGSYHELGEHEKGFADRSEAIRLAPESGLAWAARGNAYFLLSRYKEAASDLRKAAELLPNDQDTKDLLARAETRAANGGVESASAGAAAVQYPRAATQVEAKESALTVVSILDLPRVQDSPVASTSAVPVSAAALAAEASVPVDRPVSAAPTVSEEAVFTPSAPVALAELRRPKESAPPPGHTPATPPPQAPPSAPAPSVTRGAAPAPALAPPAAAPLSAEQLHQQARALMGERKYDEAVEILTRALALKPNHALALNARGFSNYMLKKYDPALKDLNSAIKLDPNYTNAYHNRAILFQRTGQQKAADEDRQVEQRLLSQQRH